MNWVWLGLSRYYIFPKHHIIVAKRIYDGDMIVISTQKKSIPQVFAFVYCVNFPSFWQISETQDISIER